MIREKRTQSGGLLEIDFFPVFKNGKSVPKRKKKQNPTPEEKILYNQKQATKKMIRLVNANFDKSDYYLHPTYADTHCPKDEAEAKRNMENFLRRVKRYRVKKLGQVNDELKAITADLEKCPSSKYLIERQKELKKVRKKLKRPLKYIYVTEKKRLWHHHLFMSGGLTAGEIEKLWMPGIRCKVEHYRPDIFGYEAAAAYIAKDPQGSKRYIISRNLTKPAEKHRDGGITDGGLSKILKNHVDDADYWERRNRGYRFVRAYPRFNEYNGRWYLSIVMYKYVEEIPSLPLDPSDWLADDWGCDMKYEI